MPLPLPIPPPSFASHGHAPLALAFHPSAAEQVHHSVSCLQGCFAGPRSVKAIREGEIHLPYDTPFVYAEVNADEALLLKDGQAQGNPGP